MAPRLIITGVPIAPADCCCGAWCFACAVLAKGALFKDDAVQRRVQEGMADTGRTEPVVIVASAKDMLRQLEAAVSMGPHPLAGGAVVPLCWLHLPAVDGTAPPPEPATARQQLFRGNMS